MLSLTGLTAAVLGLSLLALHFLVQRDEVRDLDDALFRQASAAAAQVLTSTRRGELAEGEVYVPEGLTQTARYLVLFDAGGMPRAASRAFEGRPPTLAELGVRAAESVPVEGNALDFQVGRSALRGVIVRVGETGESLLFAASRRSVIEDVTFLQQALVALFVCAMAIAAFLAQGVGRVLSRDVTTLAGVARAVTHGDLDARVGNGVVSSAETRALATDLDEMIARLAELVRTQRSFVSHAAHELRSPIATLRGELQLALRRPRDAEAYRRVLETALEDVEALGGLTEDLLALARTQARMDPAFEVVGAAELVADAVRMARGLASARSANVRIAQPESDARVRGTRSELARVLRNLIDNAVQHGSQDVVIEQREREGMLELSVRDSGQGVKEADREKIFAPFVRGEHSQAGAPEGSGLGLAIARGIAREYGGDVELDATYATGARFVFRLPVCA